ncbi:glycosyltransferase [Tamlana haliotis]|uniref:Glycosyltransferase n=1 Tax=Pseudotamlana haliotis TaxID=2614804 RepID=A0A6N6MBG9_9FLAO|nr:glycosyltransferase family 2 protein [Tamlana haliotis]KAB1067021.1 glycosyltransferase [Tamlana haliotis]
MLISIITINYNDLEGLKKTMTSVLSQTFKDVEYIVIDGGSTDGSKDYIKSHEDDLAYWVSEPDSGIYNAMNKGIDQVTGDYVLFLNSGDYLVDQFVLKKFIAFNPVEDLVYGNTLIVINGELVLKKMAESINSIAKCLTNTINHQTIFYNKRLFDDGSRYDCTYKICSDWVFTNNAIIFKNASSRHIDLEIPVYDTNGVSGSIELRVKDRKRYLETNFDSHFLNLLKDYNQLNTDYTKFKNNKWILRMLKIKRIYTKIVKKR